MTRSVLMIVTSHDRLGGSGKATGIWAEELAVPYYAFVDAGMRVEIASPRGGKVPLDPGSLKPVGENPPAVERFLADAQAQQRIAQTAQVGAVDTARHDAVFLPGGHGTMWDLPDDAGVRRAVESAFVAGKPVAAVCHGPAGLVGARGPDGNPMVAGRRVNAFTNAEEAAVGLVQVVPFLLEDRLRALGAQFVSAAPWQPFAVRDGHLITGQNPQSSEKVAALVVEALRQAA
jgi:putative intracellular protease/amidase